MFLVSLVLPAIYSMEVKQRILAKAGELFHQFGFKRVTMDDIALKTGVSKKTIYQSFVNKDEIVDAVIAQLIAQSTQACTTNVAKAANAVQEVFLNIEIVRKLMPEMHPSAFEDLEKFFPLVYQKFYAHKHSFIFEKVKENLERGISEGYYRSDLNINIVTAFRVETMFLPFNQSVFPVSNYSFVEVHVTTLEMYLYGICTLKGQELINQYKQQRAK